MLNKLKQRKSEGFTIIEVMIVLAIAGLIMLIVFLAVPALQRNSRNTQYKAAASAYASAIGEWSQNNGGKVPASAAEVTAINALAKDAKLVEPSAVVDGGPQTADVPVGQMQLNTSAKCSDTTTGNSVATPRAISVRYSVETSGGLSQQCIDAN